MSIDNAMDRLRAANPAPDKRLLRAELEDLNVLLSATWQRSTNVQTQPQQETQQSERPSRRGWLVAAAVFTVVVIIGLGMSLVATNNDNPPAVPHAAPVIIVAQVDFDERPVIGTFEVTDGADVLQCSSGTFEDGRVNNATHLRIFTCESGANEGTFTATFTINDVPTGADDTGSWSVAEGSNDFVDLQGNGDWSEINTGDLPESVATWTGDISYSP